MKALLMKGRTEMWLLLLNLNRWLRLILCRIGEGQKKSKEREQQVSGNTEVFQGIEKNKSHAAMNYLTD